MNTAINTYYSHVDNNCFKHDMLDRIRLKRLKREFKNGPDSKKKLETVVKYW